MRNPTITLAFLATIAVAGTAALAQPAFKLATVNLARAYENYWETKKSDTELEFDRQRAMQKIEDMQKQGQSLVDEFKSLDDKSKNTALSKDARDAAATEARGMFERIREKEQQVQQFVTDTQRLLQRQQQIRREMLIENISKVVQTVGKGRGATVIVDTSGPTANGVSAVVFADPGFDITEEVIRELNKNQPADMQDQPPAAAPSAEPPAATP